MPILSTLSMRLFALIAVITLAGLGLLAWLIVDLHTQHLEHETVRGALRLSDSLARGMRTGMLENRKDRVYEMMQDVGQQPGIERLRVINKRGKITFSSAVIERGQVVDMQAEACTRCHVGSAPVSIPPGQELTRIFASPAGHRVVGLITPIYNEAACAAPGCHPEPETQHVLGVMDMQLSLAEIDQTMAGQNRQLQYLVYLFMLVIASTCGLFVWRFVHRPVHELIIGTERIGAGQLDHRITVQSRTEIGRLAASFNQMAGELARAQQQLSDWAHTLEQRVEEKTRDLQQAQARLVHNEKMASLGALAAVVAHEINNPLSGVLTYAKLVSRMVGENGPQPERLASIRRSLQTIETETARCGNIVKNLLEFSRQSGAVTGEANVNDILERTLFLIAHKVELQGIGLTRELAEDLPLLNCDPDQIQQAMLAMLINAAEAMPDGGRLYVATRLSGEGTERQVEVEITDTGMGIPQELIGRLFEPFFTTKQDKKGVGLGLSVVYGIVRRHHGRIDVRSEVGRGTTFLVSLPEHGHVERELLAGAPPAAGKGSDDGA
ncbi:MAG: ATP-binding protein [Candidatus Latescibacterota bacterium]|jgi:two-component system NtrC family sensor kinase